MKRGALVLCGGRSVRMGRDKATLPFGDEVLLQRVVRLVGQHVDDLVVVAHRGQRLPALPADVRIAHDEVDDQGPMGGLVPGLKLTTADAVYATGCDVPFLRGAVVDLLFERLGPHAVAVAEAEGYVHPLAAVYRTEVRGVLERLFAAGRRRPRDLYDEVDTLRVDEETLRVVDPDLLTLANLNTPEAYEAALQRLGRLVIRVELYEGARQLTGVEAVEVEARTLGEALVAVAQRYPALAPRVIEDGRLARHWRASLNGKQWIEAPETPLSGGDAVVLVSALAGG